MLKVAVDLFVFSLCCRYSFLSALIVFAAMVITLAAFHYRAERRNLYHHNADVCCHSVFPKLLVRLSFIHLRLGGILEFSHNQ